MGDDRAGDGVFVVGIGGSTREASSTEVIVRAVFGFEGDKEVAEAVTGQLTKAGIRTRVKTHEWTTYLNQLVYPHKANPMYLIGWGNTTWDADGTLGPLFRSGNSQANYNSPDFDALIDEAQRDAIARSGRDAVTGPLALAVALTPILQRLETNVLPRIAGHVASTRPARKRRSRKRSTPRPASRST